MLRFGGLPGAVLRGGRRGGAAGGGGSGAHTGELRAVQALHDGGGGGGRGAAGVLGDRRGGRRGHAAGGRRAVRLRHRGGGRLLVRHREGVEPGRERFPQADFLPPLPDTGDEVPPPRGGELQRVERVPPGDGAGRAGGRAGVRVLPRRIDCQVRRGVVRATLLRRRTSALGKAPPAVRFFREIVWGMGKKNYFFCSEWEEC